MSAPLYYGSVRFEANKVTADSLFFQTMGIDVLSGVPEKELMQKDVVFLSDRLARKMFDQENPIGREITASGLTVAFSGMSAYVPFTVSSISLLWKCPF